MYLVVRFFFKKTKCHWEKSSWAEKLAYRSSSVLQRSSVSFFLGGGPLELIAVAIGFSEVVGEVTHVAEENKIGVGWVKVKVTYFASSEVKKMLIKFSWKKFHIVWIVLEDSSAGHLKIFLDVSLFLFLSWGWLMFVRLCLLSEG